MFATNERVGCMERRRYTKNQRKTDRRYHLYMNKRGLLFVVSLILVINTFLAVGMVANAKEKEVPMYKYYKSYMVEKDDTLLSIAYDMNAKECSQKQINECVDEMISINSLDHKGTICYGNYILVPYYSTEYR